LLDSSPLLHGLGFNISSNITDIIAAQLGTKSGHTVFTVGDLINDGRLMTMVVSRKVSLQIILLQGPLAIDNIPPPIWQAEQLAEKSCSPCATSAATAKEGIMRPMRAAKASEKRSHMMR
jgi:hypothetical protein